MEEQNTGRTYTEAEVRELLNKGDTELQLRVKAIDVAIASQPKTTDEPLDTLIARANAIYEYYRKGVIAV